LKTFPGTNSTGKQLTDLFIDCLSKGDKGTLDLEAVEAILKRMTTPGAAENTCYFIGRFLEKRGQSEAALRYLDRCATAPREANGGAYKTLYQTLAMAYLRDQGAEPGRISGKAPK
jgi:hypothetical protein